VPNKAARALGEHDRRSIRALAEMCPSDFFVLEALLHKGPMAVNALGKKIHSTSESITTAVDRARSPARVAAQARQGRRSPTGVGRPRFLRNLEPSKMNPYIRHLIATGSSWAPLPLRLALGSIMIGHGAQKLFGIWGGPGLSGTGGFFEGTLGMTPGVFWAFLAGFGEFGGGLLVLLGLFTRLGAALTGVTMLVAIALVHRHAFFLPEGMEFALSLLLVSVSLMVSGGGAISADRSLQQR
jgi:putative oxidoreductase